MLEWKTDWNATDNHARAGSNDLARLVDNYADIAERLRKCMGITLSLEDIELRGYETYPFADLLNSLERNLAQIFVLPVDIYEGSKTMYYTCGRWRCGSQRRMRRVVSGYMPVTWYPMEHTPTYLDINRWETNGMALDRMLTATAGITLECGVGICGGSIERQLYGDFYGLGAPGRRDKKRITLQSGVSKSGLPLERQLYGDWGDDR